MIHSTAIIDPSAEFAGDAEIGPYCVIGPDVVIGSGCVLKSHVTVAGPAKSGGTISSFRSALLASAART